MKLKLYRKIAVATIAVVVMFSLILIGVILASHVGDSGDQMESIVVAVPPLEQNGLLYVAQNQGFFASNGLEVTINDYDRG
jgi:ABC-type nitrate/sulfonate/bicarbonate transport system substrate-binding protein